MNQEDITFIRRRKISHLQGKKTPQSCGYCDKLYLWDDQVVYEKYLKEGLNTTSDITTLNGVPILVKIKERVNDDIIFFDIPDYVSKPPDYPQHYKIDFFENLDNFFETFKLLFQKNFLTLLKETPDINVFRSHSDKICSIKMVLMETYLKSLVKYPKISNNKRIREFLFFKNTFQIFDSITRYIKSFIFSNEYKKFIQEKKFNSLDNFVDFIINSIFKKIKGHRWFIYEECEIPKYLKVNGSDVYKRDIIKVNENQKDFLFKREASYNIKDSNFKSKITILDLIKANKSCWFNIQTLKKNLKNGDFLVTVFFPMLKATVVVNEIEMFMEKHSLPKEDKTEIDKIPKFKFLQIPFIGNGLDVPGWVIKYYPIQFKMEMHEITNIKFKKGKSKDLICDGFIKTLENIKFEKIEHDGMTIFVFFVL